MKIGIIVAMDKEFVQLKSLLSQPVTCQHGNNSFVCGTIQHNDIILMQCGIGKVNSSIGTVEMIRNYAPDLVVSTGVAGGADTQMNVMDVVVGTAYVYHDVYCGNEVAFGQVIGMPEKFTTPQELTTKATQLNTQTPIYQGLIVTGDWFVNTREKMQEILNKFPMAKAVDMESCSIAHTCHRYQTPFVSFRIISDIPLKDKDASQYYDFWERLANQSFEVTRAFLASLR